MSQRFTVVTIGLAAAVAFLLGIIASGTPPTEPAAFAVTEPPVAAARAAAPMPVPVVALPGAVDFADVADRVNDAVVNIDSTASRSSLRSRRPFRPSPDEDSDGQGELRVPRRGSGSGFIIDPAGYILTNYHVIDGADRIAVTLADGRTFRAHVVGTDPDIDVALIKIGAREPLPAAPLGDSDQLRVGEWVCAIGNPLGYVHSVTVGVVSFVGRKLFDLSLDDYIQTDAAINFGNSGGPLINSRGEVIGINSAISQKASSIGFAVPINQATAVLPQLMTHGRVSRGYIGVSLTDVSPDLQRSLHLPTNRGALVLEVTEGSPGQRAGLRPYDLIAAVDDRAVWTNDELIREISARLPGTVAHLRLLRDNREETVLVKLAERPSRERAEAVDGSEEQPADPARDRDSGPPLGLTVRNFDPSYARRFGIPRDVRGVIVSRVDTAGTAYGVDIQRGFVIMEINRQPIGSVAEYLRVVTAARPGDVLAFYVYNPIPGRRDLVTVTIDDPR